ncbi:hypothetical protein [Arthrobacter sp. TB 23]|uniref:hypothetical protein n=1 Tax=Arthrobacter sp. TB 23 TaxID=494419 RepID=UPI00030883AA|nr:hypothetical protein [Arthrobacter sp. TB 23]
MNDKTRLAPEDPFPEDLDDLADGEVEVLNSKVHRQIDEEYVDEGQPHPETEFRKEELDEELDERDDDGTSDDGTPDDADGTSDDAAKPTDGDSQQ